MEIICGIYKITSPSGRVYIGQSWDTYKRWRDYNEKSTRNQPVLNYSFKKYGKSAHTFAVIHSFLKDDINQDVLNEWEIHYINVFKQLGFTLLNCREGGSNGKLSAESLKKMSESLKGKPSWNKGMKGVYTQSEETKRKQSLIKKGKPPNNAGKPRSKDAIEKSAFKNSGRKRTLEQRLLMSERQKGRPYHGKNNGKVRSAECRKLHSEIQKARLDNKGELHNLAKISNKIVYEIRQKFVPRIYSSRRLAKEYGISKTNVLDIVNRRIWRHI